MKANLIRNLVASVVVALVMGVALADYKAETVNGHTWIYEQEGAESFIVGIVDTPSGTLMFPAELGGKPVRNLVGHGYGSFGKYQWREADWYDAGGYWQCDWSVGDDWLAGVTGIVIPEGVTNICDRAFGVDEWTNIETGERHFSGWYNLKIVSIPDSLQSCSFCLDSWGNAFYGTPFLRSEKFPDFILNKSETKLWGVKAYNGEWDYRVCPDVVVPATVTEIADYALGCFGAYSKYDGEEWYGISTFSGGNVRIVFDGAKPTASELAFANEDWVWDEAAGEYVESCRIYWSGVYYHEGTPGWKWGEEWCGVKTYALNDIPDAYAVESDIRIGRNFGGGWWSWKKGGATYTEREIWRGNEMGLYGDENAFIEVYGTGAIKPVVFHGDTPSSYLGKVEIWSDQKMFETFTPPGLAASAWKAKNSDCGAPSDHDYYHETANGRDSWEWDMLLWPDKKVVPERRWIVVPAKEVAIWAGIRSIRVGIVGTSEISDTMLVRCTDEAYSPNPNDFFHGMAIFGVETFEAWDDEVAFPIQVEDGQYHAIYMQTYEFGNESAYFKDKQMSFTVKVPSAGTMIVTGGDDWGSDSCIDYEEPAYKEDFTVVGDKIVSDVVQRLSAEWDDGGDNSNFIWNETNFWKTSCSAVVRRIAVSGGTTLTFTRRDDGDDAEFKRMYFFPQGVRSVAVEAAYIGYEQTTNARYSDYWGHNYVQGYVTGNGVYKSGETATLKAISGDGEEFDHWVVRFGNLTLTDAQKTSPTLSFMVTDAMCGAMEDEAQIFLSAIWKPKYKVTALPSIVGAGEVTGTGRYYEGAKVTLTATANKGYDFVKWSDGATAATRTVDVVAADVERVIYAYFVRNGDPIDEYDTSGAFIPGAKVEVDTGLVGYKAKGLPSGLKLNKKTGVISGTPKKPGTYVVTFTKKGEETVTMTFVVDPFPTISIAMEGDTEKCKVTGASKPGKGYLVGKKVNIAARAPKGTAFVGWFMNGEPWPDESTYLAAKQKYVMTEKSLSLVAWFEREKMSISCPGLPSSIAVGAEVSIPIAIETQSGVKSVKGSKLPSGLKVKKVGDGWAIVGTPKKAGTYNAKVKVTAKSGAVEEVVISVVVE